MNLRILISSAFAVSALTAGVAMAQDATTAGAAQDQAGAAMQNMDPTTSQAPADAPAAAPAPDQTQAPAAEAATTAAAPASATMANLTLTNGPVADTPENRAKYKPLSRAGQRTSAKGN